MQIPYCNKTLKILKLISNLPIVPNLTPSLVYKRHALLDPPTNKYSPLVKNDKQQGSNPIFLSFQTCFPDKP